jgi:hypothetical protein
MAAQACRDRGARAVSCLYCIGGTVGVDRPARLRWTVVQSAGVDGGSLKCMCVTSRIGSDEGALRL